MKSLSLAIITCSVMLLGVATPIMATTQTSPLSPLEVQSLLTNAMQTQQYQVVDGQLTQYGFSAEIVNAMGMRYTGDLTGIELVVPYSTHGARVSAARLVYTQTDSRFEQIIATGLIHKRDPKSIIMTVLEGDGNITHTNGHRLTGAAKKILQRDGGFRTMQATLNKQGKKLDLKRLLLVTNTSLPLDEYVLVVPFRGKNGPKVGLRVHLNLLTKQVLGIMDPMVPEPPESHRPCLLRVLGVCILRINLCALGCGVGGVACCIIAPSACSSACGLGYAACRDLCPRLFGH